MPYVNRYFHKRDVISPTRRSYQMNTPSNAGVSNTSRLMPRYVTAYEYGGTSNDNVDYVKSRADKRYTTEVNTNEIIKNDYRQQIFQSPKKNYKHSTFVKRFDEGIGSTMNLRAEITAPSGTVSHCDIIDFDNHHFNIQFTPQEAGEHRVSVKSGKLDVPGSPFKFFVENVEDTGSKNVQVFGMGLQSGYANEWNEFSIYSRDSSSGNLSVSIDGPSKAVLEIHEIGDGTFSVKYNIPVKGEYQSSVKFNNEHIPGSPFRMMIEDPIKQSNSGNITLASVQNHGIVVGNTSAFTFKHGGLERGVLRAFAVTPSMQEENVKVNQLGEDNFNIQFEPTETGCHHIHVLLDESPISGSPFQLMVGDVIARGNGLVEGNVGEENHFELDTKFVEPGPLTVTIDGPSKVELECFETDHGYEFSYVPTVQGEYIIAVKYGNNIHAKGSPFKVNISGNFHQIKNTQVLAQHSQPSKSFAENVKCRGDGLVKAYIGRNNQFVVDASSGGAGVLFVGISGPFKPFEEVNVKHIGGKRFQVNYFVQEFGEHIITVRWGERDIPGSPYIVYAQ